MPRRPDEQPTSRPLASSEPATVARLLVRSFPPKEAVPRARAMLADLRRLLPRHDWERHLRSAMRSELGMEPKDWMEPPPASAPQAKESPGKAPAPGPGGRKPKAVRPRAPSSPRPSATPAPIGPTKSVARLSEDLERILLEEQMRQEAPPGMEKCPMCGAVLEPTRNRRVRTHDNPVKGTRCEASKTLRPGADAKV